MVPFHLQSGSNARLQATKEEIISKLRGDMIRREGFRDRSVYSASKAALKSLASVSAIELAPKGIRVNAISPGPFSTPVFEKSGAPAEALAKFADTISQKVLLKRYGEPGEVGKLVSFLSCEDASFITGGDYLIDGGMSINFS